MIMLVDRASGRILCELEEIDFEVLRDSLVLESEEDRDYYLNAETLDLLAHAGMSASAVKALSENMRHRGLDLGWELKPDHSHETVCNGRILDQSGQALGGIRVDILHRGTVDSWTYSRPTGSFSVCRSVGSNKGTLRLSGRGDLVLMARSVADCQDGDEIVISTLWGVVQTDEEEVLAGVNVSLTGWGLTSKPTSSTFEALGGSTTWGDTDDEGRFFIPVRLPEDSGPIEIELELTTADGSTLEKITRTLTSVDDYDLGVLRAPCPEEGRLAVMPLDPLLLQGAAPEHVVVIE